jgi:predicted N-acetyltransferase YhbS
MGGLVQDFSIRPATSGDSEQILGCLREAFEPFQADYTESAFAATVLSPEALRKRFSEMEILVACRGDAPVIGTISYCAANDEGRIRGMAVSPALQGTGVALALLMRAQSSLQRLNCRVVTLDTTAPLCRAIAFYERNGFERTGDVASFFGMELLIYRKELLPK